MNRSERRREKREKSYTLDDLISARREAYRQAFIDAYADKNKKIDAGAKQATSHAFAYLVGITVKIMAEEFKWNQEECEWMVEKMLEEYNNINDVEVMKEYINKYSGMTMELED